MLIIFLFISVFNTSVYGNINYESNFIQGNAQFINNPQKAIDFYKKSLKFNATPLTYAKIADCYKRLADLENAKIYYDKAIEVEEFEGFGNADMYYRYSLFLNEVKDYTKALKYINLAISKQNNTSYLILKENIKKNINALEAEKTENADEEIIQDDDEDWTTENDLKDNSFKTSTIFRGDISTDFYQDRVLENGLEDASELSNSIFLEIEHQYSENMKIMLSSRLYWRLLVERNEDDAPYYFFNGEKPKTIFDYELEESYIDYKYNNFSYRVGQQYFKWGENIAYSRSDIINPNDFRDSIIPELDKRKVAVFSLTGGYSFGEKAKLTLAWIPFRYNPKISYWGRDFALLQPSKEIDTSLINNFISQNIEDDLQSLGMTTDNQKKDFTDSSIALNLSFSIKSLNTSFVYYYGFQELPEITMDKDLKKLLFYLLSGGTKESVLAPLSSSLANKYIMGQSIASSKFTRYNHLAFSASLPISSFILNLDASYSPKKLFYSDIDTTNEETTQKSLSPIYKKVFNYTLGIEYQYAGDKLLIDLEYLGSAILDDNKENYFYDRKNKMGIFSLIKWNIIKDDYSLILLGNYNFFFKDYLATIRFTKHIGKLDINAGYNHFGGDNDTPIGRYDKNDEFFLGIKYYF